MTYVLYLSLILAFFFLNKYLISFFHSKTLKIKKEIDERNILNGMLSIKDLKPENYNRFIEVIKSYLAYNNFRNISILPSNSNNPTNITATLNQSNIYISCIQNPDSSNDTHNEDDLVPCNRAHIQSFLSKLVTNSYSKGILITNTYFDDESIKFVQDFNSNNTNLEIKLINGYELTKCIRSYSNYLSKVVLEYENK